jgi:hypothetical protein
MLQDWNTAPNAVSVLLHEQRRSTDHDFQGCGDVENIYVASAPGTSTDPDAVQYYTRSAQPQIVADSECNSVCSGDSQYLCGSGNLLTYYAWNGTEPLYTWNFPTGNDAGEVRIPDFIRSYLDCSQAVEDREDFHCILYNNLATVNRLGRKHADSKILSTLY